MAFYTFDETCQLPVTVGHTPALGAGPPILRSHHCVLFCASAARCDSSGFHECQYSFTSATITVCAVPCKSTQLHRGRSAWDRVKPIEPFVNANRNESLGLPLRDVEFGQKAPEPLAAGVDGFHQRNEDERS